jgi:hypothetical protein
MNAMDWYLLKATEVMPHRILSLEYLFSWSYARMSNRRQEESSEPVPKAVPSGKNYKRALGLESRAATLPSTSRVHRDQ